VVDEVDPITLQRQKKCNHAWIGERLDHCALCGITIAKWEVLKAEMEAQAAAASWENSW